MQVVAQKHEEFGMRVESRRGPKRKKPKNVFCKLESIFFFLLFFHYSFSFTLQT
jgi:hypothetical protein